MQDLNIKARRAKAEWEISDLYGCPGTTYDTEEGREFLIEIVDQLGFAALTDEAVIRLAAMHVRYDERPR